MNTEIPPNLQGEPQGRLARPLSILLIEDDALFTRLMTAILEQEGHEYFHADRGAEAIAWLETHRPRLVITDYRLSDMTAEELAERIDLPPFIVITGAGSEQVAVNMMKLGARDYLAKDATFIEKLPKTVSRVLRELDVEDRMLEAERTSRETQERLRLVLQGSQDGFWDLDLTKGEWFLSDRGWAILEADPATFSSTQEALLARIHPEDRGTALEEVTAHLEGKQAAIELQIRVAAANGSWKWVLLKGRAVATDAQGSILRLAGTLGDATERKLTEESQLRAHKMESL
jgi:CheY-like chemotaxis protein